MKARPGRYPLPRRVWNRFRAALFPRPPMTKEEHVRFWVNDNLQNIIPKGVTHPAGWDEVAFLGPLGRMLDCRSVVEFGCGYGRLCPAFAPQAYVGVDFNPRAVERARSEHPEYRFELIAYDAPLPPADLCLAYTVLLHVDDQFVASVAERIKACCSRVLIVEILGRHQRQPGLKVPIFTRERAEYERLFAPMTFEMEIRRPYRRYPNTEISFLHFVTPPADQALKTED